MWGKQMLYFGPLLQGYHIAGGNHIDLVAFKFPCSAAIHESAGINEDKVGIK